MGLRDGSAALIRNPRRGRPGKLAEADWAEAAGWRDQGLSDAETGRRLGVANTTIGRRLGPRQASAEPQPQDRGPAGESWAAEPLFPEPEPEPRGSEPGARPG